MRTRTASRILRWVAPGLFVGVTIVATPASAGASCSYDPDSHTVTNTDTIRIIGGAGFQYPGIFLYGGPFAPGFTNEAGASDEIEFVVNLGGGDDLLRVYGSMSADRLRFGIRDSGPSINLNAAESDGVDADVRVRRTEAFIAEGLDGNDIVMGTGGKGTGSEASFPLTFRGGAGNDRLVGGSANDVLNADDATGDADVLKGRGGGDTLNAQDGDALDSLDGGSGANVCSSDFGDVVANC